METKQVKTKVLVSLAALIVILGLSPFALTGNLEPIAPPGPTMKTLDEVEPRIPIHASDLPLTISQNGSYYLTEDVTTTGTAITVAVDDVTIDLAGFALVGPDSGTNFGIYMNGRSNVKIRNGTIRDFYYGIHEAGSSGRGHRVIDVRSVSNSQCGISLNGKSHLVKGCTASGNGNSADDQVHGIYTGSGSTVTGNTACDNGSSAGNFVYGIYTYTNCTVTGNTACNNGSSAGDQISGIRTSSGCTVTGNTACDNGSSATGNYVYGIYTSIGCTVTGNTTRNNGNLATGSARGIYASSGCTVTGNTAYDNGISAGGTSVYGIYAGFGSTVTANTAYDNGDSATGTVYGIFLSGHNLVDQNTAYNNNGTNMDTTKANCTYGTNHAP